MKFEIQSQPLTPVWSKPLNTSININWLRELRGEEKLEARNYVEILREIKEKERGKTIEK